MSLKIGAVGYGWENATLRGRRALSAWLRPQLPGLRHALQTGNGALANIEPSTHTHTQYQAGEHMTARS